MAATISVISQCLSVRDRRDQTIRSRALDVIGLWPRKHQIDGMLEVTASGNDLAQLASRVMIRINRRTAEWTDAAVLRVLPDEVRAELGENG